MSQTPPLAPVISVCHGGGPMPVLNDPDHRELIQSMRTKVPEILGLRPSGSNASAPNLPKAIVLVTAHWSESIPHISSAAHHDLLYDYGGFPPESYQLKYPAPGSPEVAKEVFDLLDGAGMKPVLDEKRGWDHGVFVPLLLIEPSARIPIIQLSVLSSASPSTHFAMGQALAPLRARNIAIIGSGMPTFHNLRIMFSGLLHTPEYKQRNKEWSHRLTKTLKIADAEKRRAELEGWRSWTGARDAHPEQGQEHFLPLIVCAGAAGDVGAEGWADEIMGSDQWTYYWK
ncbi:extradiol ring-cleavage dioxygenase protein [Rutstroemia sp. NJR-2017a BBW]|nr:extradiol ring-cleavage dioxygenase protein [Rutstroemia sp. NJR-2017a BBW]